MTLDCKHKAIPNAKIKKGFGITPDGKKICLACCGRKQVEIINRIGATKLYLTAAETISVLHNTPVTVNYIGDYAETFKVVATIRNTTTLSTGKKRTNIAFYIDGYMWWGFRIHDEGKNLGMYHCRRRSRGRLRYNTNNVLYSGVAEPEVQTTVSPLILDLDRFTFEEVSDSSSGEDEEPNW